jgi:hypothetical protein
MRQEFSYIISDVGEVGIHWPVQVRECRRLSSASPRGQKAQSLAIGSLTTTHSRHLDQRYIVTRDAVAQTETFDCQIHALHCYSHCQTLNPSIRCTATNEYNPLHSYGIEEKRMSLGAVIIRRIGGAKSTSHFQAVRSFRM